MFSSVLRRLDQMIADHAALQHPFYQAWCAGELALHDLAIYAWAYYPHVEAFPQYLEIAIEKTHHESLRACLYNNWCEEVGEPLPHHELWLRFAAGLGVHRQEVLGVQPLPDIAHAIETFRALCNQDTASALAALYTYESQQPDICRETIASLQCHYQIHDPQTLAYFTTHLEADIHHREEARHALQICLQLGTDSQALFEAAQSALDAQWRILNAISLQAGIPA